MLQTLFEQVSQSVDGEPEILVAGISGALHLGQRLTGVIVWSGSIIVSGSGSDSGSDLCTFESTILEVVESGLSRYF